MDSLLARIDAEVAAGRPWRAKEIMRGNISNAWPHPEVVERYGQLLLGLGDEVEAGKYLWLSGARTAAYERAVALFLARHGRQGRRVLLAQLPKSLRRIEFDQLPAALRRELAQFDIKTTDFGMGRHNRRSLSKSGRWKDSIAVLFGLGFLICVIVGVGVGFRTIVEWIARAFR